MFNNNNSSPTIINCSFISNYASEVGGAMVINSGSNPTIKYCTFVNNTADINGPAIRLYNSSGGHTLTHSILWGNGFGTGSTNIDILVSGGAGHATNCIIDSDGGGTNPGSGNINQDPLFVNQPIGMSFDGEDLRLQAGSPAIDFTVDPTGPMYDQDGRMRPVGAGHDLGAYEHDGSCPPIDLSANLVSYWSFDNSVIDHIGSSNGTIIGSGSSYTPAAFGNGLDLDGGNTYANMGNDPSLDMTNKSMTISAWFRVDAFTQDWQTLLSKGEGANFRIARSASTDYLSYNGAFPDVVAAVDINDASFHHVLAVTKHAEYKEIYIDGVLYDTETAGVAITDGGLDLLIGNNPNILTRDWNGMIDDLVIWDTNLTACAAEFIYNAGMSIGDILDIPTDNCPPNHNLTGTINTNTAYQTDGCIESTQIILAGNVDYNSGECIELNAGFEVKLGALFQAFIDGCASLLGLDGEENK